MIPFQRYKDAKQHKNLQVGDVCLLHYGGMNKSTYRICVVIKPIVSDKGLVWTVRVGYRPEDTVKRALTDQSHLNNW